MNVLWDKDSLHYDRRAHDRHAGVTVRRWFEKIRNREMWVRIVIHTHCALVGVKSKHTRVNVSDFSKNFVCLADLAFNRITLLVTTYHAKGWQICLSGHRLDQELLRKWRLSEHRVMSLTESNQFANRIEVKNLETNDLKQVLR